MHIPWPKIQSIKHAIHASVDYGCPKVKFRGTVKLHGTNASVVFRDGKLVPQSRNRRLSVESDNHGFASFVEKNSDVIRTLGETISKNLSGNLVLFGEFVGANVQKGVALSKLQKNQWVLFGMALEKGGEVTFMDLSTFFEDLPSTLLTDLNDQSIWFVFQAPVWEFELDFSSQASINEVKEEMDRLTESIDQCCPWGKMFGIEGTGEGLVWQPLGDHFASNDLGFKTKGAQHKIASVAKTSLAKIEEVRLFCEEFLTEERMNQGVSYLREMEIMGEVFSIKNIPDFLKWIGQDIKTEGSLRLQELGIDWKDVSKLISSQSAKWFKSHV